MRTPDENNASVRPPTLAGLAQEIQAYLQRTRARFGVEFDPTMGRVIAVIPESWRGEAAAWKVAYGPGLLTSAQKEMLAACVSAMNACEY